MLRTSNLLRRACVHGRIRRGLHEDTRADFLGISVPNTPGSDPRYGMDMTRAPGYEVAADEAAPLVGNEKLADFAVRHARLSTAQVGQADGYMWVGSVLYPTNLNADVDVSFSWEASPNDPAAEEDFEDKAHDIETSTPVIEAKRRYTGGQARRIRKERDRSAARKATKRPPKKPMPKPYTDDEEKSE